jgi:hypothetical protein
MHQRVSRLADRKTDMQRPLQPAFPQPETAVDNSDNLKPEVSYLEVRQNLNQGTLLS